MLRHRVIPVVLIDGYSVLKTIKFDERRNLGNPITVVRTYNTRNVDELFLLDIDASKDERSIDIFTIKDAAKECFMPLTVGGGLKSVDDIRKCLNAGADKVCLNSAFLEDEMFVKEASSIFGAQCIVVSIDFKKIDGSYRVYSHKNEKLVEGLDMKEAVIKAEKIGAGEILLNSVDRDGEMKGMDLEAVNEISKLVNIPVVLCGGVGEPDHCVEPIQNGISAVGAASIFHFTRYTPEDCRESLRNSGIMAR